jgi:hypothetical protein
MTVERINEFAPGDRYKYDCSLKGFAQVDTKNDASYYGTWTNPHTREIFTYCEGDTSLVRCSTDEEYQEELRSLVKWATEAGI